MRKLTAHGFGALPDFLLCRDLLGSEIYSFVWSRHLWLLRYKNATHSIVFNSMTLTIIYIYTAAQSRQATTGHNWQKPVSVLACAHFMMIWTLTKDLKDERVHAGRKQVSSRPSQTHHAQVRYYFQSFSPLRDIRHIKERKWHFRGNVKIHDPNFLTTKSKIQAPKLDKTAIRCDHSICRFVQKILFWLQNLGQNIYQIRRSIDLFTPSKWQGSPWSCT